MPKENHNLLIDAKRDITMPVSRCDLYDPITNSNNIKDHLIWKNCKKMTKIEAWNRCGK